MTDLVAGTRADEAASHDPLADVARDEQGRVADRSAAQALGRAGGRARAARMRQLAILDTLGLRGVALAELKPFLIDADEFARHKIAELARDVGGGSVGAGPAAIIQTAALQLAASKYLFSTGDETKFALASKFGNEFRQNLLAAHHLTVLEAKDRPRENATERMRREILEIAGQASGQESPQP